MQRYITLELYLHSVAQLSTEKAERPRKKLMKLWQLVEKKEAKPSDMEKKFRLQLQDKLDASTTVVNSRFKVIIKFQS